MITKKICMLGAFSVGKTALVKQYVHSMFSDQYLSTVGVKISKKIIHVNSIDVTLILWDMEGKDEYVDVNISYLRGAMGFFVVADGTRRETLDSALNMRLLAIDLIGKVPHMLLMNKADIADQWEITDSQIAQVEGKGIQVLRTSAKTGQGVEEAFTSLTKAML